MQSALLRLPPSSLGSPSRQLCSSFRKCPGPNRGQRKRLRTRREPIQDKDPPFSEVDSELRATRLTQLPA
ncbi:hypothetical protein NDU88_004388 [Pleurodeles waltl]|uniref:Uncharacterized protein n=1 Tax=Pleurodeles waltl TaxID=8319 RepID=A0AAV7TRD3_PLEWA|nr:hypothetical protein NDU88_004388 [Pleurodeles waltl]